MSEAIARTVVELVDTLQAHRRDMHNSSPRPCLTCARSAALLRSLGSEPLGGCEEIQRERYGYEHPRAALAATEHIR